MKTDLINRVQDAFWGAYGGPLKVLLVIALLVMFGMPLLAFIKKILR